MSPDFPSPKDIRQLAAACRKAGITYFKCGEVEFQLSTQTVLVGTKRKGRAAAASQPPTSYSPEDKGWDNLTEEEKLFFSSAPAIPEQAS